MHCGISSLIKFNVFNSDQVSVPEPFIDPYLSFLFCFWFCFWSGLQDDEANNDEEEDLVESAEKDFFYMINADKKKQAAKNAKANQANKDVDVSQIF